MPPPTFELHNTFSHRGFTVWAQNTMKRQYVILSSNIVEENTIEIELDGTVHGKSSGCFNVVWEVENSVDLATPLRATVSSPRVTQEGVVNCNSNVKIVKVLTNEFRRYSSGEKKLRFPATTYNAYGDLLTASLKFACDPVVTFRLKFKKPPKKTSGSKRKQPDSATDSDEDTIYVQQTPRLSGSSSALEQATHGQTISRAMAPVCTSVTSQRNGSPSIEDLCERNLREAAKLQAQKDCLKESLEELIRKNNTIDLVNSTVARILQ
ncbi:hypothetical protein CPB83DRAFT_485265 [Crepidotus variabilis]|uniref:Uncharacterized protein n=1 Tax=Crepidotus variabilis TaxID=179855 RepID=A0A9P6ES19_9AGAR|nr:hypothetical protein CPB83DRAFT_485265 [Crepidotus variabilis]